LYTLHILKSKTTNLNLQVTLQDNLVLLRPLKSEDYEALYEVARDPLIWEQHPSFDRYKPDVFSHFFDESIKSEGALVIIDRKTDKIIGSSRYKRSAQDDQVIEIGWTFLARNYWGGVYNGSVKKLMIAHAFSEFNSIVFYIGNKNFRSQKAVEKIGAKLLPAEKMPHLVSDKENTLCYILSNNKTEV
jgi:N-acetyltransferase